MCAERESDFGEAVDDSACPGSGEAVSFAGFVGVADALDCGKAGGLHVSHGVADECAFAWLGLKCFYCAGDQVRAGFEEGGVVVGPRNHQADPVVHAVARKIGVDSAG
jgi:hypothetical protein